MKDVMTNSPFGPEDMARRRKRAIATAIVYSQKASAITSMPVSMMAAILAGSQ